jgi:hypothetical protein
MRTMIFLILVVIIAIAFIAYGGFMVYAAISGKGITPPEPDALFQLRIQYKLRGLIGVVFIFIGCLIFAGIFNAY